MIVMGKQENPATPTAGLMRLAHSGNSPMPQGLRKLIGPTKRNRTKARGRLQRKAEEEVDSKAYLETEGIG